MNLFHWLWISAVGHGSFWCRTERVHDSLPAITWREKKAVEARISRSIDNTKLLTSLVKHAITNINFNYNLNKQLKEGRILVYLSLSALGMVIVLDLVGPQEYVDKLLGLSHNSVARWRARGIALVPSALRGITHGSFFLGTSILPHGMEPACETYCYRWGATAAYGHASYIFWT
jgi:hypothetical protein